MEEQDHQMTDNISEVTPIDVEATHPMPVTDEQETPQRPSLPVIESPVGAATEKHDIFDQKDWELKSQQTADTKQIDMGPDRLQTEQEATTKKFESIKQDPEVSAVLESKDESSLLKNMRKLGFGFLSRKKPNS